MARALVSTGIMIGTGWLTLLPMAIDLCQASRSHLAQHDPPPHPSRASVALHCQPGRSVNASLSSDDRLIISINQHDAHFCHICA